MGLLWSFLKCFQLPGHLTCSPGGGAYLVCRFLTRFSETSSHLQRKYGSTLQVFTDAIKEPCFSYCSAKRRCWHLSQQPEGFLWIILSQVKTWPLNANLGHPFHMVSIPNVTQHMGHFSFMLLRNTLALLGSWSSLSRSAAKQAYLYPGPKLIVSQWPASQESSKSSINITEEPDPWGIALPMLKGKLENLNLGRDSKWRGYLLPGPKPWASEGMEICSGSFPISWRNTK